MRWLLENHEEPQLKDAARALLQAFCDLRDDEKIENLQTQAQWKDMDILVTVETNERKLAAVIEDKIFSAEHDQLEKYNKTIDAELKEYDEVSKVFYKTSIPDLAERERVEPKGWKIFDIYRIYDILNKFASTENLILSQYVEHLQPLFIAASNTVLPKNSETMFDYLAWHAFFLHTVAPHFKDKYGYWIGRAGQYPYIVFKLYEKDKKDLPFLEIRSRDCLNGSFIARILCFDVEHFTPLEKVAEKIKADRTWACSLVHRKGAQPKQIGKYAQTSVFTSEDFIKNVKICADYFSEVTQYWEKNRT